MNILSRCSQTRHIFVSFLFFLLTNQAFLESQTHPITQDYLLPKNHLIQKKLKKIFIHQEMFNSLDHLKNEGFDLISHTEGKIMVAAHPKIENFLIKKFNNNISQKEQLENYMARIAGARALRKFIRENHLSHIIVPQKWLYPLPSSFSDPATGEQTYLLIVEKIDICQGKGKRNGEVAEKYRAIDLETLDELCKVVYHFRGLDSAPCNMPFTYQNQIAFIDTECWEENRTEFLPRILPYLTRDRQEYALNLLEKLSSQ